MLAPLILDFDRSTGSVNNATVIDLADWQEQIRFGATHRQFQRFRAFLEPKLPHIYGTVLLGSGDYHHLSLPLIERINTTQPFQVIVFDNHPDNMRFPFGVHCGSWVHRVAQLPQVSHVHVLGITSNDIGLAHAWENHWRPLLKGKLTYWCMDVDIGWAKIVGLAHAFRRFDNPDALITAFLAEQSASCATYLTIDKDVLAPEAAKTNWDQGKMLERHLMAVINSLNGQLIGSDITGEVSSYHYQSWWKRQLSALDEQPNIPESDLKAWQQQHHQLNTRLLAALANSMRT